MAPDASAALAVRQKVEQFLNAARTGNLDLFKKLAAQLDDGKGLPQTVADVKDANKRGALHFAAREGKTQATDWLAGDIVSPGVNKACSNLYNRQIVYAIREGMMEVCNYLVEALKLNVDTKDEDGETPLLHAARQGHTATAKYLIECVVQSLLYRVSWGLQLCIIPLE
ncbi:ankyrin repeat family protein [Actinidia rufa]|uniref:Ankyrin repeat family protein n=1 Tax=Actinidia rufa TaxID=165716 RepID=A0A7J0E3V9_9ERIC|nr:ankyrin repeat family protein [Actinidia rufa]